MRTASSVTTATTRSATPPTPPTMSLSRLVETKFDPILCTGHTDKIDLFLTTLAQAKQFLDTCSTLNAPQQRQWV